MLRSKNSHKYVTIATRARYVLAAVRVINGLLALVAPSFIVQRFGEKPGDSAAAIYALRLFGIRTIVIGIDLATEVGPALSRTVGEAVVIHASDTATVVALGVRGRLARPMAIPLGVISALNTVLALIAYAATGPASANDGAGTRRTVRDK